MRIDGGGSGKTLARVALAGEGWFVGGEVLCFHGNFPKLRRFCARSRGKKLWVSAVTVGMQLVARGKEMGGQHGEAVVVAYLGTARLQRTATGSSGFTAEAPPSWRCTGEGGE